MEIQALKYALQSWRCNGSYFHGYIKYKQLFSVILLEKLKPKEVNVHFKRQLNYKVVCETLKGTSFIIEHAFRVNFAQKAVLIDN